MSYFSIFFICVVCYLIATIIQILQLFSRINLSTRLVKGLVFVAVILQGILLKNIILNTTGSGIDLIVATSVITWLVVVLIIMLSFYKPVEGLLVIILPLTILFLTLVILLPPSYAFIINAYSAIPQKIMLHLIISAFAYGWLFIAALQGLVVLYQQKQLKKNKENINYKLPSLQTMEKVMFHCLTIGIVLLTLSLLSGIVFLANDDIINRKIISHKTIFAVVGWVVLLALVLAHWYYGLRGSKAVRWLLLGCGLLLLSYYNFTISHYWNIRIY